MGPVGMRVVHDESVYSAYDFNGARNAHGLRNSTYVLQLVNGTELSIGYY